MTDPPRWIDGNGPPGAQEVLNALVDAPTMPLRLRVHAKTTSRVQWDVVLGASATLLLLVAGSIFIWWRLSRPVEAISVVRLDSPAVHGDATAGSAPPPAAPTSSVQKAPPPGPMNHAPVPSNAGAANPGGPTMGTMRVIWSETVTIRLNGDLVGSTPLNREVPVGEYEVEVELPSGARLKTTKQVYAEGVTTLSDLSDEALQREERRLGFEE